MNYKRKYANLVWSSSVYEKRKYLLTVVGYFYTVCRYVTVIGLIKR